MCASSELQFGALREGGSTREAGSTVTESLVVLYKGVRTRFGEGGGQLDRRRARGGLKPCAQEPKARTGRFLRAKLISNHVFFSSTRSGERAIFAGLFQGCTGLWTAGCWLARRLHQLTTSTTMYLGFSIFPISVQCVALRSLDLLIKTGWSVICPLCC